MKDNRDLFRCLEAFLQEEKSNGQWAESTCQNWEAFKNHLLVFKPQVTFSFFDEDGLQAFVRYLRYDRKLSERTVRKYFICLKWFLRWSVRKGFCTQKAILGFQPKFKVVKKTVIFLTKPELLHLLHFPVPENGTIVKLYDMAGNPYEKRVSDASALAKARDMFCFCSLTSLRFSDMIRLRWTDISGNKLSVITRKTSERIEIELNCFALGILDRYRSSTMESGNVFPPMSNQRMNIYIKEVCELCGMNTPVSLVSYRAGKREEMIRPKWAVMGTHAGRRTFICLALSAGIPPQVVMKWTGHTDYQSMKPYIDIAETVRSEAMACFEKSLTR